MQMQAHNLFRSENSFATHNLVALLLYGLKE